MTDNDQSRITMQYKIRICERRIIDMVDNSNFICNLC